MLEEAKIVQIMWNTSLRIDADFNIESVYGSSPKYFWQARMYQTWEAINNGDFIYSHFTAEAGNLSKCKSTKRTSPSTDLS